MFGVETRARLRFGGVVVAMLAVIGGLLPALGFAPGLLGLLVLAAASLVIGVGGSVRAQERPRPRGSGLALLVLIAVQLGFGLGVGALVGFARASAVGGGQCVVWLGAALAVPGFAALWVVLARRGLEPSLLAKLGLGLIGFGLACACMGAQLEFGGAVPARVGLVVLGLAAASLGPASLEGIAKLAPGSPRGACWTSLALASVFSFGLGGWLIEQSLASGTSFELCLGLGFAAVALAVLSSVGWRPGLELVGRTTRAFPAPCVREARWIGLAQLVAGRGTRLG